MKGLAALTLTLALPALAISNLDVGPNHRLIGSTQIGVRVEAGERLRLSARSYPAAALTVDVFSPGASAQRFTVQPGADGWRDDAVAPLLVDVPAGASTLQLAVPGVPPADARFDFSLEVVNPAGAVKPGRVYSGRWEFDSGNYLQQTNADFWVRVPTPSGDAVWQLEMNGLAGWQFQVQANRVGVEPPSSSRSVPMATNWLRAGYDVYLEPPDLPLAQPSPVDLGAVTQLADGLRVSSSSAGSLSIDVDLDGDGVAPSSPRERLFSVEVPGGSYDVTMSWVDGLGQPIPAGAYDAWATLATDEVHFTAVDVEYCSPGIRFFQYTGNGPAPADMSWDDTQIDDGTIPRGWARSLSSGASTTPAVAGVNAHAWGGPLGNAYGPGNQTFIDTWASAQRVSARFRVVTGAALDELPRRDDPFPGSWVTTRDAGQADAGAEALDAGVGGNDAGSEVVIELPLPAPVEADAGVSELDEATNPPLFTGSGCSQTGLAPALALALLILASRRRARFAAFGSEPLGSTTQAALVTTSLTVDSQEARALVLRPASSTGSGCSQTGMTPTLASPRRALLGESPSLAFDSGSLGTMRLSNTQATLQTGLALALASRLRARFAAALKRSLTFASQQATALVLAPESSAQTDWSQTGLTPALASRRRALFAVALLSATSSLAFDSETLGPVRLSTTQATALVLGPERSEVALSAGLAERPVWYGDAPALSRLLSGSVSGSVRLLPTLAIEGGLGLLYAPPTADNPLWSGARASDAALGLRWRLFNDPLAGLALFGRARIPTAPTVDFAGGAAGAELGVAGRWSPHERVVAALELSGAALTGRRSNVRGVGGISVRTLASLWVAAEIDGLLYVQPRTDVGNPFPLELRAALRWQGALVRVGAIVGAGLNHGVGAPEVRALLTFGVALPFDGITAPVPSQTVRLAAATPASPATSAVVEPTGLPVSVKEGTEMLAVYVEDDTGALVDADVRFAGQPCRRETRGCYLCAAARGALNVAAPGRFPLTLGVDASQREVRAILMPEQPAFAVRHTTLPLELDLYFETNDATLSIEGERQLARFVERLAGVPGPLVLVIDGHADVRGAVGGNMLLSLQRAEAVRRWLRANGANVPLVVSARGATEAQASSNDDVLARDRRVHVGVPGVSP